MGETLFKAASGSTTPRSAVSELWVLNSSRSLHLNGEKKWQIMKVRRGKITHLWPRIPKLGNSKLWRDTSIFACCLHVLDATLKHLLQYILNVYPSAQLSPMLLINHWLIFFFFAHKRRSGSFSWSWVAVKKFLLVWKAHFPSLNPHSSTVSDTIYDTSEIDLFNYLNKLMKFRASIRHRFVSFLGYPFNLSSITELRLMRLRIGSKARKRTQLVVSKAVSLAIEVHWKKWDCLPSSKQSRAMLGSMSVTANLRPNSGKFSWISVNFRIFRIEH